MEKNCPIILYQTSHYTLIYKLSFVDGHVVKSFICNQFHSWYEREKKHHQPEPLYTIHFNTWTNTILLSWL